MLPPSPTYSRAAVAAAGVGVILTVLLAFGLGARAAGYWLALVIGGFGVARLALPAARIAPFAVRDRWVDAVVMLGACVLLGVATAVAPL